MTGCSCLLHVLTSQGLYSHAHMDMHVMHTTGGSLPDGRHNIFSPTMSAGDTWCLLLLRSLNHKPGTGVDTDHTLERGAVPDTRTLASGQTQFTVLSVLLG